MAFHLFAFIYKPIRKKNWPEYKKNILYFFITKNGSLFTNIIVCHKTQHSLTFRFCHYNPFLPIFYSHLSNDIRPFFLFSCVLFPRNWSIWAFLLFMCMFCGVFFALLLKCRSDGNPGKSADIWRINQTAMLSLRTLSNTNLNFSPICSDCGRMFAPRSPGRRPHWRRSANGLSARSQNQGPKSQKCTE